MNKRVIAGFIDLLLAYITLSILIGIDLAYNLNFFHKYYNLLIALPIIKDIIFKHRSIGKKIMHLEIRTKNNKKLTIWRLLLRNITLIIWPVELFLVIAYNIRIGDIITETIVVGENQEYVKNKKISLQAKRLMAIAIDLIFIIILCLIPYFLFCIFNKSSFKDIPIIMLLILIIFINKDLAFKNKSLGKKVMDIEIRTINEEKPNFLIIIFRNIFIFLYSIDLFSLILFNKRIEDYFFDTKVIETRF